MFYVADVEAAGRAADGEIHVDLEKAYFLAVFPLADTGHLRLIGPVRRDEGREHRELSFDDVSRRAIGNLKLTIGNVNWFFDWQPHMRRAGLRRAALYLIRPDGYVGLADLRADPERLRRYFHERGVLGQQTVPVPHAA